MKDSTLSIPSNSIDFVFLSATFPPLQNPNIFQIKF
jgi:hypothetical protein